MPEVNHSQRAHAKLSASSSATWLNCPASIRMQDEIAVAVVNDPGAVCEESPYAQEGTRAHEVADLCLQTGADAEEYIGRNIENGIVDADMAEYVQVYLDIVRSFPGDLYPEQRVDFSNYISDGFGTSDAIVFDTENKKVRICDLKYGQGVPVSAIGNTQGRLYGLGVLNEYGSFYDIETVELHIIQPRLDNFTHEELTVEELHEWGEWARDRALLTEDPDAPFNPSDKACQWCKATHGYTSSDNKTVINPCKAYADNATAEIDKAFEDVSAEPERLTDEQMRAILDKADALNKFVKAVKETVHERIEYGGKLEGYKLVEGRSVRKWTKQAEQVVAEELGEDAYDKKLIGITKAEKLLGKERVSELTEKPPGKPSLVKDTNPKPEIDTVKNMFGGLT